MTNEEGTMYGGIFICVYICRLFPLPEDFLDIGLLSDIILSYNCSQWRDRDDMWISRK